MAKGNWLERLFCRLGAHDMKLEDVEDGELLEPDDPNYPGRKPKVIAQKVCSRCGYVSFKVASTQDEEALKELYPDQEE